MKKKSIKRLELNKRTISNLNVAEMNSKVGGVKTNGNGRTCISCNLSCTTCNKTCSTGCL